MTESRTSFRPPLWATALLLAGLALFLTAGFWQLNRAAEKREFLNSFDSGAEGAATVGQLSDAQAQTQRFRRIELSGRYDADRQVLVENMMHDGKPGYHVLTPYITDDRVIMVNRGWVKADPDRTVLPDVSAVPAAQTVTGLVDTFRQPGLKLDAPVVLSDQWPQRLSWPDAKQLGELLAADVADYQLLLDESEPGGYVRIWNPVVMSPEKHVGYAVQWFGFAVTAVIIYVLLNVRRGRKAAGQKT